jgi:D-lactate dehydrogenase
MTALPAAALADLRALLGDALRLDPAERLTYGFDNSRRQALPDAVALVTEAAQVLELVRICRRHRVPVVARGRGTNTTGASVPVAGGVVVSLRAHGPHRRDPPGRPHRGRAAGAAQRRPAEGAGTARPVLAAGSHQRAVLHHRRQPRLQCRRPARGEIRRDARQRAGAHRGDRRRRTRALRRADHQGCDRLRPVARADRFGRHARGDRRGDAEADAGRGATARAARALRDVGSAAAAVARLDGAAGDAVDARIHGRPLRRAGAAQRCRLACGRRRVAVARSRRRWRGAGRGRGDAGAACGRTGCLGVEAAVDEAGREALWAARKSLSPALRTLAPGKINEDVVVPVSRIPELVARVQSIANGATLPIVCFGHAGNGNLHVNILYHPDDAAESARAERALGEVFDACSPSRASCPASTASA